MATEIRRAGDGEQEIEIDLRQLVEALFRRKWIIVGLCLVACVTAYFASNAMTPVYEATTTVLVNTKGLGLDSSLVSASQNSLQRLVEVLKSRSLALRVAQELGHDWTYDSPAIDGFRSRISVQPVSASELLRISVQHPDPEEAMRIANAIVNAFVTMSREMNSENVRAAREFIGEQLVRFEAELEKAEEELVTYRQHMSLLQPSTEAQALISSITSLQAMRVDAMVALEMAYQRLNVRREELAEETRSVTLGSIVASHPIITGIRTRLVNLEVELAAARERYTDAHPRIIELQAEIDQLHVELNREIARLEEADTQNRLSQDDVNTRAEIMALTARIEAIDELIREREAQLNTVPEKELELTRLTRNKSVTESIYTMLRQRYEEMRISEAMEAADVSVLDPAIVPRRPIKPRTTFNVAVAGVLGVFVGVGLAFLLEFLDTTFKSAEEVESYLGLPILGRTPVFELASDGKRSRTY